MNESPLVPREELSDLDWLARNVHEWRGSERCISVCNGVIRWTVGSKPMDGLTWLTKKQWLARRAELQNKPSWDACPEWAQWLAQDADGCWHWFKGNIKPEIQSDNKTWSNKYASFHKVDYGKTGGVFAGKGSVLGFCNDTLEQRPEKLQPFTSIEDNQEQEMKQDNGWFERGELPPVGEVCEWLECHQTGWQKVTLAGHYENAAWIVPEGKEPITVFNPTGFRPIRTERDELVNVFINHYSNPKGAEGYIGIADAILAAGFKRDGGEK